MKCRLGSPSDCLLVTIPSQGSPRSQAVSKRELAQGVGSFSYRLALPDKQKGPWSLFGVGAPFQLALLPDEAVLYCATPERKALVEFSGCES